MKTIKNISNFTLAVDFDGTLCANCYPHIGKELKTVRKLCRMKEKGVRMILWTCRSGDLLAAAVGWCKARGLAFDYINESPAENIVQYGNDSRKVFADYYVDDRAYIKNAERKILRLLRKIEKSLQGGDRK